MWIYVNKEIWNAIRCEISIVSLFAFEQYGLPLAKEHLVAGLTNYARKKKEPITWHAKTLLLRRKTSIIISDCDYETLHRNIRNTSHSIGIIVILLYFHFVQFMCYYFLFLYIYYLALIYFTLHLLYKCTVHSTQTVSTGSSRLNGKL